MDYVSFDIFSYKIRFSLGTPNSRQQKKSFSLLESTERISLSNRKRLTPCIKVSILNRLAQITYCLLEFLN